MRTREAVSRGTAGINGARVRWDEQGGDHKYAVDDAGERVRRRWARRTCRADSVRGSPLADVLAESADVPSAVCGALERRRAPITATAPAGALDGRLRREMPMIEPDRIGSCLARPAT